jgi:hypothetical protein
VNDGYRVQVHGDQNSMRGAPWDSARVMSNPSDLRAWSEVVVLKIDRMLVDLIFEMLTRKQVIEYLNKKGYTRTEAILREESAHVDKDGRPIPQNENQGMEKYRKAFDLLSSWIDQNLDVYKVSCWLHNTTQSLTWADRITKGLMASIHLFISGAGRRLFKRGNSVPSKVQVDVRTCTRR